MSKNTKNEIAENVIENVIENVTENVIEDSSSIIYGWKIEQRAVGEPITFEDGRTLGLEWKGIPIGFDVSPDQVQTSFFKSPATERVRRLHDCGLMTYPEAMVHAWGFLATIDAQTDKIFVSTANIIKEGVNRPSHCFVDIGTAVPTGFPVPKEMISYLQSART